jgi:hypothetical protein
MILPRIHPLRLCERKPTSNEVGFIFFGGMYFRVQRRPGSLLWGFLTPIRTSVEHASTRQGALPGSDSPWHSTSVRSLGSRSSSRSYPLPCRSSNSTPRFFADASAPARCWNTAPGTSSGSKLNKVVLSWTRGAPKTPTGQRSAIRQGSAALRSLAICTPGKTIEETAFKAKSVVLAKHSRVKFKWLRTSELNRGESRMSRIQQHIPFPANRR